MLIGYDEISASTYEMHKKKKQMYFNELLELARSVIEVKDEQQFILRICNCCIFSNLLRD